MRANEMTHLPSDIRDALNQYDTDVANGRIEFGPNGEAVYYPGKENADASVRDFFTSKLRQL